MASSLKEIPRFDFTHAGSDKPLAWPKYKLKECWTLLLCLLRLRGRKDAVIVHNWHQSSTLKFTREFRERRAARIDPRLADAPIVEPHAVVLPLRLLLLCLAAPLALLPVASIIALTRVLLPKQLSQLVVFCDGHLSGFSLALAASFCETNTMTLQHGLSRNDDRGSVMGIRNFVSDRICLWDGCTEQTYRDAGVAQERLLRVGEYGFGGLSQDGVPQDDLALLCPPYNVRQMEIFKHLETVLPRGLQTVWSLHPMLRADHQKLVQVTVATVDPRPGVAICGDSGALMDALARRIPIITVSDRPLATSHLTMQEARDAGPEILEKLIQQARNSLSEDRSLFGFDPHRPKKVRK